MNRPLTVLFSLQHSFRHGRLLAGMLVFATFLLLPNRLGADGVVFHWNNSAGGDWGDTNNWSPRLNNVPGIDDTVFITLPGQYTVTGSGNAASLEVGDGESSFPTLLMDGTGIYVLGTAHVAKASTIVVTGAIPGNLLTGGSFTALQGLTLDGNIDWRSGILGGIMTVTTNGSITGSGELSHLLDATVYNHGKFLWNAPTLTSDGSWLENFSDGVIDFQGDTEFNTFGGARSANIVINGGTMLKSAGTGVLDFTGPAFFTNNAALSIKAGTLRLYNTFVHNGTLAVDAAAGVEFVSGSTTLGPAHTITGEGFYGVPEDDSLNLYGNLAATNFQLNGRLMGDCSLSGTIHAHSGSFQGALAVAPSGLITLSGCTNCGSIFAAMTLSGQLANAGTINWLNGDLICLGGSLSNLPGGAFNILCDNPLTSFNGQGDWSNAGVIRKSATAGTNDLSGIRLNSQGLVDIQTGGAILSGGVTCSGTENTAAGATLLLYAGAFDLQPGHAFTGAGYYGVPSGGNITLLGTLVGTNFQMHGVLHGTNVLAGTLFSYSGEFAGATTVAPGSVVNLDGCVDCGSIYTGIRVSGSLTNAGTVNWRSGSWYGLGGTLVNQQGGLVDIQGDLQLNPFGIDHWYNYSGGFIRKSAGNGTTALDGLILENGGIVHVQRGVLQFKDNYHPTIDTGGDLLFGLDGPGHYGRIQFTSTAPLTGVLSVDLQGGYKPALGDSFTVIEYPAATGDFTATSFPGLPAALNWESDRTATAVTVSVISSGPRLGLTTTGGVLGLQWSMFTPPGYHLRYATNLASPILWLDVTNLVEEADGQFSVHVTPDPALPHLFFQLQ